MGQLVHPYRKAEKVVGHPFHPYTKSEKVVGQVFHPYTKAEKVVGRLVRIHSTYHSRPISSCFRTRRKQFIILWDVGIFSGKFLLYKRLGV